MRASRRDAARRRFKAASPAAPAARASTAGGIADAERLWRSEIDRRSANLAGCCTGGSAGLLALAGPVDDSPPSCGRNDHTCAMAHTAATAAPPGTQRGTETRTAARCPHTPASSDRVLRRQAASPTRSAPRRGRPSRESWRRRGSSPPAPTELMARRCDAPGPDARRIWIKAPGESLHTDQCRPMHRDAPHGGD